LTATSALKLTATARAAARRELSPGESLRIAFVGGCGALGYRLSRVRRAYEGDMHCEVDGVPILLDAKAAGELSGVTLDHVEEAGFLLQYPGRGASG
jgi:Fe-S cluster assembly iron-binding protein IscA